jgi:site-specific recombinase XerD
VDDGQHAIGQSRTTLMKRWRMDRGAVLMDDLHFHGLRHTTASGMNHSGVDLCAEGAVLGHKSAQSTKRYSHTATKTLSEALGRVGKRAA